MCAPSILFLLVPIVIVMMISLNESPYLEFPPQHFSLRWYQNFFAPSRWLDLALLSLRVAPVVMVCATLLGTTAAIGIMRGNFRGRRALEMFFVAPSLASLTPSIAMEQ